MYFDALLKLGLIAILGGILATIYFYVDRRRNSPPGQAPSVALYFGVAILVGIGAYIVGTAIGIYFACSSPTSGNLCGVYGALGVGPLLSGVALFLYGLAWRSKSLSASVGAPAPATAAWHSRTEHLVRVIAGFAGAGLALYGAMAVLDGEGRGAAAAMVIGMAGVYWGVIGRLPSWFRR